MGCLLLLLKPMPQVFRVSPWIRFLTLSLLFPALSYSQSSFTKQGGEFAISGPLIGDQTFPQAALSPSGGYIVWEDNGIDGSGTGIAARKIDSSLSATLNAFRVNDAVADDQNKPQIALLKNGGAIVVWQGGRLGSQHIFARLLKADGTFSGGDLAVSSYNAAGQLTPAVAALAGGGSVVVWASYDQDGSMQGVFAQRLSATGEKVGPEFSINQYTAFNQRTPAVAALANGNFVVAWVSEQQRYENSVDIYARLFDANGNALGNEFLANTFDHVCANPSLAATKEGGWVLAWSERTPPTDYTVNTGRSWDVYGRLFKPDGAASTDPFVINSELFGDQYAPRIVNAGAEFLAVWTSIGQDGSREGVYGRFISLAGAPLDQEFLVNTTTINRQIHPALAADGGGRVLAAWSSIMIGSGFDLFGQRYAADQPVPTPAAPFVSALSEDSLSVAWPPLAGFNVDHFELYADGSDTPVQVRNNFWIANGLLPASTHEFKLAYVLSDGRHSALSAAGSGKTWDRDFNGDSLPDDWQTLYWGSDPSAWPAPGADSDQDGVSNFKEFLAGTDPTNPNSVLRARLSISALGRRLTWNTQPGLVYQVQSSSDLSTWANIGTPRFAAGSSDSVLVAGSGRATYYRVIRTR